MENRITSTTVDERPEKFNVENPVKIHGSRAAFWRVAVDPLVGPLFVFFSKKSSRLLSDFVEFLFHR